MWTGYSWDDTVPDVGRSSGKLDYQLAGAHFISGEECIAIDSALTGSFELQPDAEKQVPLPIPMEFDIEVKRFGGTGQSFFSKENGWLIKANSQTDLDVGISMKLPEGMPVGAGAPEGGMKMSLKIAVKTTLELTSADRESPQAAVGLGSGQEPKAVSLENGLPGRWTFKWEGDPADISFFPGGRVKAVINRAGGIKLNMEGTYKVEGTTVAMSLTMPDPSGGQVSEEVVLYNTRIAGSDLSFNFQAPEGPSIKAYKQ
jgi:hypothetical protein